VIGSGGAAVISNYNIGALATYKPLGVSHSPIRKQSSHCARSITLDSSPDIPYTGQLASAAVASASVASAAAAFVAEVIGQPSCSSTQTTIGQDPLHGRGALGAYKV
jgi:hypothetical protein